MCEYDDGMRAFVVIGAALIGACGSEPTCEQLVDHVAQLAHKPAPTGDERARSVGECTKSNLSAAARRCVLHATTIDELAACASADPASSVAAYDEYMLTSMRSEAELHALQISKELQAYDAEHAAYPTASAGPTPPIGTCCKQPKGQCPPDPTRWADPTWQMLHVEIDEPIRYSYQVDVSSPGQVIVRAIGDLDCDGTTSQLEVRLTAEGQTKTWTRPDE